MTYEKYSTLELITPRMLHSTVMCDERTCLWFRKLFSLPAVAGRLQGGEEGRQLYWRYRMWSLAVVCMLKTRRMAAALAVHLVDRDRLLIPPGTTLFQLGEIYAREYGAPSLVTVIWFWDQWLRDAFLLLFTMTFGVFFFPSWETAVWLMAGCFVVACLVKALIMWRQAA